MQNIKRVLLVLMIISIVDCMPAFAQPDDGDPVDVPVNGPGLLALAAAGVAYVIKKARKRKDDTPGKNSP